MLFLIRSAQPIGCRKRPEGSPSVLSVPLFQDASSMRELLVYITGSSAKHFPFLLYQTRYGQICFARRLALVNVQKAARLRTRLTLRTWFRSKLVRKAILLQASLLPRKLPSSNSFER